MKKLLFICWDGPQVNYLEGLFYPIFDGLRKQKELEFHIIQFTWNNYKKIRHLKEYSKQLGFYYTPIEVNHYPHPALGAFYTAWKGSRMILKYIRDNRVDIVMPRSTMPAMMINHIYRRIKDVKIIFDADGLPLEERVDFTGLNKSGFRYKKLKSEETKLLKRADAVITRSQKSIAIHLETIGNNYAPKFFKVINGRDAGFFSPDDKQRKEYRKKLGLSPGETLFIYCGSLGPQYGWDDMLSIFIQYHHIDPHSKFLVLTNSTTYLRDKIPQSLKDIINILSVPYKEVPAYLNSGDIAFAIRQPSYSMQGVSPIKLGEYFLMELPTIASKGIGDTDTMITDDSCFLYDHDDHERINKAVNWCKSSNSLDRKKIRENGITHFSLAKSNESYCNMLNFLYAEK